MASQKIQQAANKLRAARLVVVLTGAGVSKESGVPTFRDAREGLWANYDPQRMATREGFEADPKLVWDWYAERRAQLSQAQPNPAHVAIAELESLVPEVVVITQNIDGLHQRADSHDVITAHGDITRNKCFMACQGEPTYVDITTLTWDADSDPPRCPECGAYVRPDIVWFGEQLGSDYYRAETRARDADVLLVVGTSGEVYPVADLPRIARRQNRNCWIIEVNPAPSAVTSFAHQFIQGAAGVVLPELIATIRGEEIEAEAR